MFVGGSAPERALCRCDKACQLHWRKAHRSSVRAAVPRAGGERRAPIGAPQAASTWQLGAFEEALDALQRRFACGTERADTWLNIGVCRECLGELERGIEAMRHALEIDARHPRVRAELARMLEAAGRPDEAAKVLREGTR